MNKDINNNINEYRSEVNPDDIWAAIEPRVDELNAKKKKKRRGIIFFFFGIGAAMLLVGGLYQYSIVPSQKNNKTALTTTETTNKENKLITGEINDAKSLAAKKEVEIKKSNKEEKNRNIQAEDSDKTSLINKTNASKLNPKISSGTNLNETSSKSKSINTILKVTKKNKVESQNSNSANSSATKQLMSSARTEKNDLENQTKQNSTKKYAKADDSQPTSIANGAFEDSTIKTKNARSAETPKQKLGNRITDSRKATLETRNPKLETQDSRLETQLTEMNPNENVTSIQLGPLGLLSLQLLESKAADFLYDPLKVNPEYSKLNTRNSTLNKTTDRLFAIDFGVHSSASVLSRKLSSSDPVSNAYKNTRNATESTLEAIHYGVDLTVKHQSGFGLTLGYQQTDLNERFDTRNIVLDTTWVNDVEFLVVNLQGDTVELYGPMPTYDKTTTNYEIYNRYRLIELPILLSYSKKFNKWDLGVQAGVLANVSLTTKGLQFDDKQQLVDLNQENNLYSTRIDLGCQIGLTIQRPIVGNLGFRISPTVKYYPNVMHKNQTLTSKYYLFGGQVGLYYSFQ